MQATLQVRLAGADAEVLASAVEPDVTGPMPGASTSRTGPAEFEVTGSEPAAFRAASNTLLRLLASAAAAAGGSSDVEEGA